MNNQEIKKLVYEIIGQEIKEHGVTVKPEIFTIIENIISVILKKIKNPPKNIEDLKFDLAEIRNEIYISRTVDAYWDYSSDELKILLKNHQNMPRENVLWRTLKNIYHEYRHAIIDRKIKKTYIETKEDVYFAIEQLIDPTSNFYLTYHDDIYDEICANNYGARKAEHYLQTTQRYRKEYESLKIAIELEKIKYQIYYRNYNFALIFKEANKFIKDNIKELNLESEDIELQIVRLLYTKNGHLKSLKELSHDPNWNHLTKEAQYVIISSPTYLKSVELKILSKQELYFILDALSYFLTQEIEKIKYNEYFRIELEKISRRLILDNQVELNLYLDALLILNVKEESNKNQINNLNKKIKEIIEILKEKENPPKKRRLIPRQQ